MSRCFELASLAGGAVKTNPNVGALLVHNDKIIGEGYHQEYGGPHAEVNAINSVKEDHKNLIKEATLYVSLEPCNIHSKTPPCSELVLKNGIHKVVIGTSDPNPKIAGTSIEFLKASGVHVIEGVLEKQALDLIRPFKAHLEGRPYIILKYAQSSDAYFGKRGKQVWLSNAYTKRLVHKWRSEVDGILVGYETARIDNPKLTTREWAGKHPTRIIMDRSLSLDRSLHVWDDSTETIFITESEPVVQGLKTSCIQLSHENHSWVNVFKTLFSKGIYRLIVEGGAATIKGVLESGIWDEARIIQTKTVLGTGIRSPFVLGKVLKEVDLKEDKIQYISRIHSPKS